MNNINRKLKENIPNKILETRKTGGENIKDNKSNVWPYYESTNTINLPLKKYSTETINLPLYIKIFYRDNKSTVVY